MNIAFSIDVLDMRAHGVGGDELQLGDEGSRAACGEQAQHLGLPRRQPEPFGYARHAATVGARSAFPGGIFQAAAFPMQRLTAPAVPSRQRPQNPRVYINLLPSYGIPPADPSPRPHSRSFTCFSVNTHTAHMSSARASTAATMRLSSPPGPVAASNEHPSR